MRARVAVGLVVVAALIAAFAWWRHGAHSPRAREERGSATGSSLAAHGGADPIAAPTPGSLSGRVTRASDGAGIAGANVTLARAELSLGFASSGSPTIAVTTDANGAWSAAAVPPATYLVAATAPGFVPAVSEHVAVGAGQRRDGIDLKLTAGGASVTGKVDDAGGGPIGGVRITFRAGGEMPLGGAAELVAFTADDGRYKISLADGSYHVSARHDDYVAASRNLEVRGKPRVLDFTLHPGATVRGVVVASDSGKPVAGALVEVTSGKLGSFVIGAGGNHATTDSDGQFTLHGIAAGRVELSAVSRGYASTAPTPVSVAIGEQVTGVKILVDHALTISGKVVRKGHAEQPVAGIQIAAFSIAERKAALADAPTDATGVFHVVGVKPATYTLAVIGQDAVPDFSKSVEVVDHDVDGVIVEVASGITVSGRVEPPMVAHISLALSAEIGLGNMFDAAKAAFVHGESDATGAFTLHHVTPGAFKLEAESDDGFRGSIDLDAGDVDRSGLVVAVSAHATIAGRVIDTNGAPVPDMTVEASAVNEGDSKKPISFNVMGGDAITDGDGAFAVHGLDPGSYHVTAHDPNDYMARFMSDRSKEPTYEVAAGATRSGVTITVDARDGVIKGRVVGDDGKGIADAWVTAARESSGSDKLRSRMPSQQGDPALTASDGSFTIGKLRRGSYTLAADGPGGASHAEVTGVKTGDTATLKLQTLATLTVHVTAGGAPVASYDLSCDGPPGHIARSSTSADGTLVIDHLPPGSYHCAATAAPGTADDEVAVATSPVELALPLKAWASLTGRVVSVLDGKPIAGLLVIASSTANPTAGFAQAVSGNAPTTDATGVFVIEHLAAGKGKLMLTSRLAGFGDTDLHDYTAVDGQRTDLGTIKIVPPRMTDAGTLGFSTSISDDSKLTVSSVKPGGPADQAGLKIGDVIASIDGTAVGSDLPPPIAQRALSSGVIGVGQVVALGLATGTTVAITSVKW